MLHSIASTLLRSLHAAKEAIKSNKVLQFHECHNALHLNLTEGETASSNR